MAQGMNKLNEALASLPEVRELLLSLDAGTSPIAVSGLSGVHRAQLTAAVRHKTQRPLLIVCADENEANRMAGAPFSTFRITALLSSTLLCGCQPAIGPTFGLLAYLNKLSASASVHFLNINLSVFNIIVYLITSLNLIFMK